MPIPPKNRKGILSYITSTFTSPRPGSNRVERLKEEVEVARLQHEKRLLEDGSFGGPNWIGAVVDPYEPLYDDPNFWAPLWGVERLPPTLNKTLRGDLIPIYITWYGLKIIRDFSRRLCTMNEFAIGAMENRCSYICGKGYQHSLVAKNGKESPATEYLCNLGQHVIDEFTSSCRWNEIEQEAVKRCDRDGECFLRFFHVGGGKTAVRFVEPEWVQSPDERDWETYGIVNREGDICDVLGYWIYEYPPYQQATFVPAEEILHIKINSDSTSKRGLPTFYPIRKNLERAEKLLRNMSILAQVQATFAVIRSHKQYSVAAIQQFQQQQSDSSWVNPWSGQTNYGKSYAPGSIIDTTENTSYEFPASSVNAGNLVAVLQAELKAAGQRVNMPAYMFSGDTGDVNLATAFIAESPFVKKMEELQAFFAVRFGDGALTSVKSSGALWRVLANAVDYGGLPRQILTDCELVVEGPTLIVRDKSQETQRYAMLNQAGNLSQATWDKLETFDYEQEQKQWKEEQVKKTMFQIELQKLQAQAQLEIQMQQQQAMAQVQQQQMAMQQQQLAAQGQQQGQQAPPQAQAAALQQQAQQQQAAMQQQQQQQLMAQPGGPAGYQDMGDVKQRDVGGPTSDSGFVSSQGGNMRDLLGLESVAEESAELGETITPEPEAQQEEIQPKLYEEDGAYWFEEGIAKYGPFKTQSEAVSLLESRIDERARTCECGHSRWQHRDGVKCIMCDCSEYKPKAVPSDFTKE